MLPLAAFRADLPPPDTPNWWTIACTESPPDPRPSTHHAFDTVWRARGLTDAHLRVHVRARETWRRADPHAITRMRLVAAHVDPVDPMRDERIRLASLPEARALPVWVLAKSPHANVLGFLALLSTG
jgi:hypothetical protein